MRSLPAERKPCGFCPKPIYPDQERIERRGRYFHKVKCWGAAKRRDPSLTDNVTPIREKPAVAAPAPPAPPSSISRADYDVLLDAYTTQELRLDRVEHLLDSFVQAITTYMSTPRPEPIVVQPPPRPLAAAPPEPSTDQPVAVFETQPEAEPAEQPEVKRQKKGPYWKGKSRLGADKPLAEIIYGLMRGRPIEGLSSKRIFEMLEQLNVRPKSLGVVAAVLSALVKHGVVRRLKRGSYVLMEDESTTA